MTDPTLFEDAPATYRDHDDLPWPQWVTRMYPDGVPDDLRDETPCSDAQMRFLAYLGVRGRWCNTTEASILITRIKRERAKAARLTAKPTRHVEGTP